MTRARDGDIQRRDFITRIRDVPGLKKFCERAMRIDQGALGIAKIDWCTRNPFVRTVMRLRREAREISRNSTGFDRKNAVVARCFFVKRFVLGDAG